MELTEAGALLLLLCILFIVFSSFQIYKDKWQLPPGPTPWPFLGNLFQKNVIPLSESYKKLYGKYGPIFTVWIGTKPMVVLCGYEIVKDALVDHAEEFGGRPPVPINERIFQEQGTANESDTKWRELRRFMLSTLRDFGMGKKTMSERVQEESRCLVEEMATTQGLFYPVYSKVTESNSPREESFQEGLKKMQQQLERVLVLYEATVKLDSKLICMSFGS